MKRHPLVAAGISACLLLAYLLPASAADIFCNGTVSAVYVSSDGSVVFSGSYRNDYTQACNVHGIWQGITSETCFTWYSALLAAKVHGKQVVVQYSTPSYTCATLPTYAFALMPNYAMVAN